VPPAPPSAPSWTAERSGALLLWTALAVGAALRFWLALTDAGIYWPDEIYQSLEPAHRLVWGRGLIAWEFSTGARPWTLPALVALPWALLRLLGVSSPGTYVPVVKLLFAAVGVATAWAVARLSRALGAGPLPAAAAGALWALGGPAIYFSTRGLSEPLSALPVTLGLLLAWPADVSRRQRLLGAALLGGAVLLRLQDAVVCVGLLLALLGRGQRRPALDVLGVFALAALALGVLDWATWGRPFQSALENLRFNVVEGGGSLWGTSEASYYLRVLWRSMPGVTAVLALGGALAVRRAPGLCALVLAFLVLHSLVPHKELRFILPVLPAWAALAGLGLDSAMRLLAPRWPGLAPWVVAPAVLAAAVSAAGFHRLTFGDLGAYETAKPQASAYQDFADVNRLLTLAGTLEDVCGLKVEAVHMAWAGGYTYFHKDARLYSHLGPPRASGKYNYVLSVERAVPRGSVRAVRGPFVLAKLSEGPCAEDAAFSWRLP
jgi:phosphatidylinositol glycan class B